MEPHHHQVVGAARFLESKLDRFIVNCASCIVGFGTELEKRLRECSVSVKQRVLGVVIELDCSHLDEVVDWACRL